MWAVLDKRRRTAIRTLTVERVPQLLAALCRWDCLKQNGASSDPARQDCSKPLLQQKVTGSSVPTPGLVRNGDHWTVWDRETVIRGTGRAQ